MGCWEVVVVLTHHMTRSSPLSDAAHDALASSPLVNPVLTLHFMYTLQSACNPLNFE